MIDKRFSNWFKDNIPEKGLSENTTFTKQFLLDAWHNGYVCGCVEAKEELESLKKDNEYAKTIIKDLLDNSDEYARQRAMDFLEEQI